VLKFSLHEVLIFFFYLGSVCCQTNESAIGWGQSAMKLTSTVFSALKNIGGSFVAVEDGTLLSTSQSGTVANCSGLELAEEAVLKDRQERQMLELIQFQSLNLTWLTFLHYQLQSLQIRTCFMMT